MTELLSLSEVAKKLQIQGYRIAYGHSVGAIPEPQRFCGKRAYTVEDVRRIAAHFGINMADDRPEKGKE